MLGKLLIFNLISFNTVCNTNTTTNANEIKALTRIESELFQDVQKWHIDKRDFLIGVLKQVGTTRLLSILVFKNHSAWVKKKLILITISKCPRYLTYTLYTSLMNDKTLVHPHDNTLVHMHEGNSSSHARRNSNPPTRLDRTLIRPHDRTGLKSLCKSCNLNN